MDSKTKDKKVLTSKEKTEMTNKKPEKGSSPPTDEVKQETDEMIAVDLNKYDSPMKELEAKYEQPWIHMNCCDNNTKC